MPLAWYSDDKHEKFHICLDCEHNAKIYREYLVIVSEDDVGILVDDGVELCTDYCQDHKDFSQSLIRRLDIFTAEPQNGHGYHCQAICSREIEAVISA